jgi:type IV secretion system protein VirB10
MQIVDHESEDALARSGESIARKGARFRNNAGAIVLLAFVVLFLGWTAFKSFSVRTRSLTDIDKNEEFRTAQTRGDLAFEEPQPGKSDGKLRVAPPPAAVPAVAPPAPIVVTQAPDDGEARRRAAEEAEKLRRLRSPMMILDAGHADVASTSELAKVMASGPEDDANRRFANQVSNSGVEISRAEQIRRTDALIPQGYVIRGILETAIQSDLPGMVRATTVEDVYSFDGRRILIPKGTMLTGEYRSGLARGQSRVLIIWTRVLRSDGVSLALGSYGTDDLGRSGLTGDVDHHYLERFGSAILLTMIGGASQYVVGLGEKSQNSGQQIQTTTTNPITGEVTTTTTQPSFNQSNAQQIAAQTTGNVMNQIAQEALKDSINIPPTVYVDQGTPIMVFVRRDLDFSALYPDPVKEALMVLKHPDRARSASAAPDVPTVFSGPVYKP